MKITTMVMLPAVVLLLSALAVVTAETAILRNEVERSLEEELIESYVLGNNGNPPDVFPLPLCAGDCDEDEDCDVGLICWERDAGGAIPGCSGGEDDTSRTDYCVRDTSLEPQGPSSSPTFDDFTVSNTVQPLSFPAPSDAPSISPQPTTSPTTSPTEAPTISLQPSVSLQPSEAPSPDPTKQPTGIPTETPTAAPTNERGPFQLKLFWHSRSCWQEDCNTEVHWCMQCEGYRCNVGDILWVEHCRSDVPPMQQFEWLPLPADLYPAPQLRATAAWGQLQSAEWDPDTSSYLCLQRISERRYTLQICNVNQFRQWFRGFDANNAFEIYNPPEVQPTTTSTIPSTYCLTMPHHPRQYEGIYHTTCQEARGDRTNRWIAVYGDNRSRMFRDELEDFRPQRYYQIGERRSNPSCKDVTPCGVCQGHCRNDDECEGSLRCFERAWDWNRWETPPGCFGDGVPGMDYCYAARGT